MLRSFFARRLDLPYDRVLPAIHLLLIGATINFALVVSVVAAQSLFLTRVGAERLAVFYLLLAVASLPVAAVVASLLEKSSNLGLLLRVILLAAVASLGLRLLIVEAPEVAAYGALLVYSLVTMQVLALYWALLTDYFTSLELKGFVVFLTMASAFGGLAGGLSLRWISRCLTTPDIVLALVAAYGLVAVQLLRLARLGGALEAGESPTRDGLFANLASLEKLARRYPMISLLAVASLLSTVIASIFQVRAFAIFAREFPGEGELTAFLGLLNAGLKALELLVAYTLTRPLIRILGVGLANLAYPLTCLVAFIALGIHPALVTALGATFTYRTLGTSLAVPVINLDYNAVPQRWVSRLRVFIAGVVSPAGMALAGALLWVVQPRVSAAVVSALGAVLSAAFLALGWAMGRAYFRSLLEMLRARTVNLEEVDEGLARLPASEVGSVREMLSSDDPQQQRLGLGLLERMDASLCEPELEALLECADRPMVRAVVDFYRQVEPDFYTHRGPRLLRSNNPWVRTTALELLLTSGPPSSLAETGRGLGRELAKDSSPEVRTVALVASYQLARTLESLADTVTEGGGGAAREGVLRTLAATEGSPKTLLIDEVLSSASAEIKVRALEVLGGMASPGDGALIELARTRFTEGDSRVRRASIGLVAAVCTADQLAELARGLEDEDRAVRAAAAGSLGERGRAGEGAAAIAAAAPFLASPQPETVAAAVVAIGGTRSRAAAEALEDYLRDDLERASVVGDWLREIPAGSAFWEPLRVAVEDAAERIRRRVFEVLSALGEESTISRVRQLLRSSDRRLRANAVETFGSIGHRHLTRPVQELLEAGLASDRRLPSEGTADADEGPEEGVIEPRSVLRRAAADPDVWIRRAARALAAREGMSLPEPTCLPLPTVGVALRLAPASPLDASVTGDGQERSSTRSKLKPTSEAESEVSMSRLLFLTKVPIFQRFTLDELAVIDAAFEPIELLSDETVFAEGQPGDSFFLLQEGKVVLTKLSGDEALEVGRVGPGEYFGEMSLFDDSPRSATAVAAEDTLLLTLDRDRLRSLIDQKPEVAWAFCCELSTRLREANERLRSLNVQLKQVTRVKVD